MQVSDEAERSVLVKLKTECGYQFTSKLESMFTDIKTSRDTMQEYKARRQASANGEDDVELAVQVCIRWPVLAGIWSVQKQAVSGVAADFLPLTPRRSRFWSGVLRGLLRCPLFDKEQALLQKRA